MSKTTIPAVTGADEADPIATVVRWIPLLIPLIAAVMACDAYFIGWAVLAHRFVQS